jgi:hypothetical protein
MKKITLFSFALVALSLASCKKTRTCTCTSKTTTIETQSGAVTSGPTTSVSDDGTTTTSYAKIKKKTAKVDCLSTTTTYTDEYTFSGTTTTNQVTKETTCTLK